MKKIKPDERYSLADIIKLEVFSWVSPNPKSYANIIELDFEAKNILKAFVMGHGPGRRYRIKGSNIIKFINAVDNGYRM